MNAVWKYQLRTISESQALEMPNGSILLRVDVQHGLITLWALVEPNLKPIMRRHFVVIATGQEFLADRAEYVGTAFIGHFVWHIFEVRA